METLIFPWGRACLLALCLGYFMVIIDVTTPTSFALGRNLAGVAGLNGWWMAIPLHLQVYFYRPGICPIKLGRGCFVSGLLGFAFAWRASSRHRFRATRRARSPGNLAALIVPQFPALIHQHIRTSRTVHERSASGRNSWPPPRAVPFWGAFCPLWHMLAWVTVPITATDCIDHLEHPSVKPAGDYIDLPASYLPHVPWRCPNRTHCRRRLGWTDSRLRLCLGLFVVAALGSTFRESQAGVPMLPLELFSSTEGVGAVSIGFILNAGFYGQLFLLPFFFQENRGYSAFLTAMAILPQPSLASVASYLSTRAA